MTDDERSLQVSMWVMILAQTIGSIDPPGGGPRKMPPPRAYVPIIISYTILQLVAESGHDRAAKYMGWVTTLAAVVLGPFGAKLVGFLNAIASNFQPTSPQSLLSQVPGFKPSSPSGSLSSTPPPTSNLSGGQPR